MELRPHHDDRSRLISLNIASRVQGLAASRSIVVEVTGAPVTSAPTSWLRLRSEDVFQFIEWRSFQMRSRLALIWFAIRSENRIHRHPSR